MRVFPVLDEPLFQNAFVAVSYLSESSPEPLAVFTNPAPETLELVRELRLDDRAHRARLLARELAHVARRLDERRLA